MTILFTCGVTSVLILVLAGCCKMRIWDSRGRMINTAGLTEAEKFKLISRWGAQL